MQESRSWRDWDDIDDAGHEKCNVECSLLLGSHNANYTLSENGKEDKRLGVERDAVIRRCSE